MTEHRFTSISEFCGRLNYRSVAHPLAYERAQFMKYFAARGECSGCVAGEISL